MKRTGILGRKPSPAPVVAALAAVGAFFSMGASPAFANASAAAADIAAPVRDATRFGRRFARDEQFQQLFSSWQSLDKTGPATVSNPIAPTMGVSIPSRAPLAVGSHQQQLRHAHPPGARRPRAHKGIDLAAPTGTPIYATADGVVGKAEWFSSYGLYVQIEHGGELETRYGHMSRLAVGRGPARPQGRRDRLRRLDRPFDRPAPALRSPRRRRSGQPVPYMAETGASGGHVARRQVIIDITARRQRRAPDTRGGCR